MKILLTATFLILHCQFIHSQSLAGLYNSLETDGSGSVHSLSLNQDSTFQFEYGGNLRIGSFDRTGVWSVDGNRIILSDTLTYREEYVSEEHILQAEGKTNPHKLIIDVRDRNDQPVRAVVMHYRDEETGNQKAYESDEEGILRIDYNHDNLWYEGGQLSWDLPYREDAFFSGTIDINPYTDSVKIQYIEYPRTWQEVVEERFLIRQDSLKLLPRKEEPSRISLFVLPHSIFVRKDH
ncbi:MAG: hypothetical protein AAFQ83_13265 [Bacteroidota bacterium]